MKNLNILLSLVIMALASISNAQNIDSNYVDGSVYLQLKDTCKLQLVPYLYTNTTFNKTCVKYGVYVAKNRRPFPDITISTALANTYHIRFKDSMKIDSFIYDLKKMSFIEIAEKEPVMKLHYTPNDVNSKQWHLSKINAFQAWDISKGSGSVIIAIVDNAVRLSHSDLKANIWVNSGEIPGNLLDDDFNGYTDDMNGYDVADDDNNPNPPPGIPESGPFNHGTHCAGIASAVTDNSNGVASIGYKAKIMAVKCTPDNSTNQQLTNAYDGVYYAIKAKANIISMSFGSTETSFIGQNLFNTASARGIMLVASAGNDNKNVLFYPAAYSNVIAVGSSNENDNKSSFSNYGNWVDVMAPGNNIYSTGAASDNSYTTMNGTSMACPLVAGLAALVKSHNPGFSNSQVEAAIKKGCVKIDNLNPGLEGQLGAGRINAYYALNPGAIHIPTTSGISGLSISPNPAYHILTLTGVNDSEISVYNSVGQVQDIIIQRDSKNQVGLNISDLLPGVYYVKISDSSGQVTARFLKL